MKRSDFKDKVSKTRELTENTEIAIKAAVKELPEAMQYIEMHARQAKCSEDELWKLQLATEEAILHLIGNGKGQKNDIQLCCSYCSATTTFTIILKNGGEPMQMVQIENDENTIGCRLMKGVMDEIQYVHENGKNILTLTKLLHKHAAIN